MSKRWSVLNHACATPDATFLPPVAVKEEKGSNGTSTGKKNTQKIMEKTKNMKNMVRRGTTNTNHHRNTTVLFNGNGGFHTWGVPPVNQFSWTFPSTKTLQLSYGFPMVSLCSGVPPNDYGNPQLNLVGGWATPLKNMSSSIGTMTLTQY